MKIFMITPGEELESVYKDCGKFGAASWHIEVRTNEETWKTKSNITLSLNLPTLRRSVILPTTITINSTKTKKPSTLFGASRPTLKTLPSNFTTLKSRTDFSKK